MTEEVSQRRAKSEPEDECDGQWRPSSDWIREWKSRLPLQTIMRMLQVCRYVHRIVLILKKNARHLYVTWPSGGDVLIKS